MTASLYESVSAPLIIKSVRFVKSAVRPAHYPPIDWPEVAFAGRSNVGKSSLINCLVQRKKLVRTSRTPGQTQTINFFAINEAFYFVDLPGYGFARVPLAVKQQWGPMMRSYLAERTSLAGVVHILDIRHPPTADDLNLWQWFREQDIKALAVLTKADKVPRGGWQAAIERASRALGIISDDIVVFSSAEGHGRQALLAKLAAWMEVPAS